ncbi:pilus assembly protein [Microbulbifer yueqingensis]|uniref:Type IV pilus assembly protein PilY1 n=1 Tax=Microbulbifer yueqingensis TaxID=658219 RepID=A0A1G9EW59_9GAMM|nr:PilC/PilY family type IV pilus protein [Microbulbifer yueqingensis]SDK80364.1 type IV pilus assembly protein PilY1 [Microbulbifer yueqingensis]
MFGRIRKAKFGLVLSAALLSLCTAHSAMSLSLSQTPLFLRTGADPNVMFILDDSGSMHFEVTPAENVDLFVGSYTDQRPFRAVYYMYPNSALTSENGGTLDYCIYESSGSGSCDYWEQNLTDSDLLYGNLMPHFDADNRWAAYFRSAHNNATYYDPTVRYRPWVKEDGTYWDNATATQAYHNPAITSKGYRNLTVDNTQTACWIKDTATAFTETYDNDGTNGWELCEDGSRAKSLTFYPATYFKYKGTGDVKLASSYTRVEIRNNGTTYAGGPARTDCADSTACTYQEEIQNFANWYSYYRSRLLLARAGVGRAFAAQGEGMRVGFGTLNKGAENIDSVSTETIVSGVRTFSGSNRVNFFDNLYDRDVPKAGTPLLAALDNAGQYYSREDNKGPWSKLPGPGSDDSQLACRASYTILMTDGYGSDYDDYADNAIGNADGTDGAPFSDAYSNTLGDIAMHYYENDLHETLANSVQTNEIDKATWQHMVTFGVGYGVTGSINAEDAFAAIGSQATVDWPNPRTGGDSAKLDDLLHAAVNGRGGFFNAANSEAFASGLADILEEISDRQTGSASSVAANSTRLGTDTVIYQALFRTGDWSGEVQAIPMLPDGTLSTSVKWSTSDAGKISPTNRKVITFNGSTTVDFQWANLTALQKAALIGDDNATVGEQRLNWVRGNAVDGMRTRSVLLGDVVNASPVFAGRKDYRFERLSEALGGLAYSAYYTSAKKTRTEVLYVSANDGMLHAIDASNGNELFAYVPAGAYPKLKELTQLDYGTSENPHEYIVDGPLFVGDAFFDKNGDGTDEWVNVLVGTYGAGGKGLFVLDVTNPAAPSVLFELDGTNDYIGNVMGQPLVAPTSAGWKIIFGNGYNSTSGQARLVVVDLADPSNIETIETEETITANGLAGPALLTDASGEVTSAYAGDLYGNMWKFDLEGNNWGLAYTQGQDRYPLFIARDPSGAVQPITSTPTLGINGKMENAVMVYFGTGSYLTSADNQAGSIINSFYAIADQGEEITTTDRSELLQKVIVESGDTRSITNDANTDWWATKKGWYMDLTPGEGAVTGERVISKPLLQYDRLIFPTLITSEDPCSYGASGWRMEAIAVGDKFQGHSIFGESGKVEDYAVISYSEFIRAGEKAYIPYTNTKGEGGSHGGELPSTSVGRMSWRQLR